MSWQIYDVKGATSLSGVKWVLIETSGKRAQVPYKDFGGPFNLVKGKLADQGIILASKKKTDSFLEKVEDLTHFPVKPLIDRSGWNGDHFAMPDGTIISPTGASAPIRVFEPTFNKSSAQGSLRKWKRRVAVPLTDHAIAMFVFMLAFMPPLLRLSGRDDNVGFELVGPGGTGKSTLQLLMSSILGGIGRGSDGSYHITFDTTLNALEEQMAIHADLPIIIEEANLYMAGASSSVRRNAYKAFVFKMSGGREKGRFGSAASGEYRFSYLSSSNEPLADLIGQNSDVAKAAGDRLITLQLDPRRPHGVFDHLPNGVGSGSEFANRLTNAAALHHGRAIRRYLQRLVQARADDEKGLRAEIQKHMAHFREKAGVDLNNGSAVRVADAFGLVYGAGKLAQKYGALPRHWKCGPAVLTCYREHRLTPASRMTFNERLAALAEAADTVHLGGNRPEPRPEAVAAASVFVNERSARRELLIRSKRIEEILGDWKSLRRLPEVLQTLIRDGGRKTVKRRLGGEETTERVYCFTLQPANG